MEICVLMLGRRIYWKISPTGSLLYEIQSHPGVQFVNPLLFPAIEGLMDAKALRTVAPRFDGYVEDLFLFETDGIAFTIDDDSVTQYKPKDVSRFVYLQAPVPPLTNIFTPFLSALRHFSKQADVPTGGDDVNFWEWLNPQVLPTFASPGSNHMKRGIAKSIVETAVTRAHIEAACSSSSAFSAPIFDTLLLDAISAHAAHDYRKSILYSAIAVETAAAIVLDEQYESLVKSDDVTAWRMVKFPQTGGKITRKDPIWYVLRKREGANDLLHEGALYILGRSLLVDNEPLYQLMARLRMTRNKIVHHGEPPELGSNQYLSIDRQGSSDALNCANEVLNWLGVGNEYKLHESGFVALSDAPTG